MKTFLTTAIAGCGFLAVTVQAAPNGAMPATQQNALVQKYCAVCHEDAHANGGLSLQHFDAANADPGTAAMMLAKLKTGAIGAAGVPNPDPATVEAWINATSAQAAGANQWTVNRSETPGTMVTASIVREVPSTAKGAIVPDLYRLTLTCHPDTRQGEMQLAWSPATPKTGTVMAFAVDGMAPLSYKVEGTETMGNGTGGSSGPGAAILKTALPERTFTVSNLFPNETVEFPFRDLAKPVRETLATCFTGAGQ